MSDGANAAVPPGPAAALPARRPRVLGFVAFAFGVASLLLLYLVALPSSTFPWYRAGLSLAGVTAAVASLRARPRGRLSVALALIGLVASLVFPALVVIVFVRYFNFKG